MDKLADAVPLIITCTADIAEFAGRMFDYQRAHPDLARLVLWEGLPDTGSVRHHHLTPCGHRTRPEPGQRRYDLMHLLSAVLLGGMEQRNRRNQPLLAAAQLSVRRLAKGNHMEANADRFLELLHQFEDLTDVISPERAHSEFDETTLQLFWMRWPQVSAWTGSLWRMLSEEMSVPSSPHTDPELDEVGESG